MQRLFEQAIDRVHGDDLAAVHDREDATGGRLRQIEDAVEVLGVDASEKNIAVAMTRVGRSQTVTTPMLLMPACPARDR